MRLWQTLVVLATLAFVVVTSQLSDEKIHTGNQRKQMVKNKKFSMGGSKFPSKQPSFQVHKLPPEKIITDQKQHQFQQYYQQQHKQQQQQQPQHQQEQPVPDEHPNFYSRPFEHGNQGFVPKTATPQSQEEAKDAPLTEKILGISNKSSSGSSPALSALALMGFLYFLNRMQDVLTTSGRRRRRDASEYLEGTETVDDYLTAIEGLVDKVIKVLPEEKTADGRSLGDVFSSIKRANDESSFTTEQRAFRIVSFMSSLLSRIPQVLGFSSRASSRNDNVADYHDVDTPASGGFWSMFGSKIGLVAKIMDFLDDPRPSRIGRANYFEANERSDLNPEEDYAVPEELSDEEKSFLPPYPEGGGGGGGEEHSRRKRFTDEDMNMWYSVGAGEQHEDEASSTFTGSQNPLFGLVFNLFKQALIPS